MMDRNNQEFDIAILGGKVCRFEPDTISPYNIGIKGGKVAVLTKEQLKAKITINATGKIISPGFIDFHSHVDGNIFSGECMVRQGATTTIGGEREFEGVEMRHIYERGFIINQGYYVSHSFTLRKAVGLKDPYIAATEAQVNMMASLAEEFFGCGAFGIHFGLEFVPGTSFEEIRALSEVAKKYNRPILIHSRQDGNKGLEYFDEIIDISRETGVAIHILHLEYMFGYNGIMEQVLEKLENAVAEGADITADTGLYDAFPACIGSTILDEGWQKKYRDGVDFSNLVISSGIYAGEKCDQIDFEYIRNMFPNTLVTAFVLDDKPISLALKKKFIYVSTNAADGPHYEGIGHPESAGTFPRLIRKYVREEKDIELMDAIKKCTCLPAQRFKLKDRGQIENGYNADIVIFDYDNIRDNAEYISKGDPNAAPNGIEYVMVNGKIVVKNGEITGIRNAGIVINEEM